MRNVHIYVEMTSGGMGIRHGIAQYAQRHAAWRFSTRQTPRDTRNLDDLHGVIAQAWDEEAFATFAERRIPLVDVSNQKLRGQFPKILRDNGGSGRAAADHLLGQGLRTFAVLTGYAHEGFQLRADGFVARLAEVPGTTCVPIRSFRHPQVFTDTGEEEYLAEALARLPRPLGLFAVSDAQATAALVAAKMVGLRVPDDVAIAGVDNAREVCDLSDPPLTSVDLNAERVGYEAAALLAKVMAGEPPPAENLVVPLGGLVARASTDVLAVDDPDVVAAVRHIRDHAIEGIGVVDVLAEVAVSRRMLERRFRRALGRSIHDEIQSVRLTHAKGLLTRTDMSMLQVAHAAGFTSQSYFGRAFAKEAGVTPLAFRRRHRSP
jgi:LacI family transcriptional regulator